MVNVIRSRRYTPLHLAFFLGIIGAIANAQVGTSTLAGTVTDSSGAVVPGASVTVTHAATGTVRTFPSNESGLFRFAALLPGQYALKIEHPGFKPVSMTEITLVSSEVRDLGNLSLQVGTQSDTVAVTAEATPVQIASAERSASVTGDQLQNIQLKGRDIFGFAGLVPGVLDQNNSRDFTTWTSMRDIGINGATFASKNVTIDGVNVIDEGANQNDFVNPNIDAVAEVRILTNSYQAEYGRNSGGTISMITKSGTNTFHGSGWYAGRRDKFNANSYFNNLQGLGKPLYKINIQGFSIGGPVIIPKVYNGKNRVFFFASQEYTNDARPATPVTSNLPTAAERNGDFSQTRQTNGSILQIIDPNTGSPFPGNIMPAARFDATGRALLNLLPMPNGYVNPQSGQQYTANFQSQNSPTHSRRDDVVRADSNLTEHMTLFVKYIKDKENTTLYDQVAPGVGALLNFVPGWVMSGHFSQILSPSTVNEITAGYGHNNYGNRRPNNEEASYYRSALGVDPPTLHSFAPVTGPPAITGLQNDEWPYVPILTFSGGNRTNLACYYGATTMSGTAGQYCQPGNRVLPQANRNNLFSVQDDLSKNMGNHNLKTGLYLEYSAKNEPNLGPNYMGNFNFGSTTDNPLDTRYGYSNALLGIFQNYTESTNRANPDRRQWEVEAYLQDNWRVSRRLTLDYGVRFYHVGRFKEINNANAGFFPELYKSSTAPRIYTPVCLSGAAGNQACPAAQQRAMDPLTGVIVPLAYQNNFVPGSGDPVDGIKAGGRTGQGDYYDLPVLVAAPRLGFAWDLTGNGKTSLRASAGTFYNRPGTGAGGYGNYIGNAPVLFSKVIPYGTINDIPGAAASALISPSTNVGIAQGKRDLERAYQTNITIQRDIGFDTVVEAAYVGNFVRHSAMIEDVNPIPLNAYGNPANLINNAAINANFLRTKYPGLGAISLLATDFDSLNYHGLQMSAQHRLTKGIQFGAAYSLSIAEGMQGWDPYTADQQARYYGPLPTDRRHILAVNYTYDIPRLSTRRFVKQVVSDWQLSGITKFQTGAPVTPICSSNNAGVANQDPSLSGLTPITTGTTAGILGTRCQMVSDPSTGFTPTSDVATGLHFNTAAFAMAQPASATVGNFGNTPIGILRQPSWTNWDLTLTRRIPVHLGERAAFRIQLQAYNIFNHPEFTTEGTTFQFAGTNNSTNLNTTSGRYTATNNARQMALTVRFEF